MMRQPRMSAPKVQNLKRTPVLDGDKVVLKTEFSEALSKEEFLQTFYAKKNELNSLDSERQSLYHQLKSIGDVEETEELITLKKNLEKVEKLQQIDQIKEQIKMLETEHERNQKDIEGLSVVAKQLE